MSATQGQARDAIAFQLVTALESYDQAATAMVAGWPDLERYHEASAQVETIRMYCAALPDLRVQWVELLIAHSELVHFLWRVQYGNQEAARAEVGAVREHHSDCVGALRKRALRYLARQLGARGLPPASDLAR
jgi:hypothetical protein